MIEFYPTIKNYELSFFVNPIPNYNLDGKGQQT